MSIALSTLVTRLSSSVPAQNGVPSADQYTQAVRDAVLDFNNAATRLSVATIPVVANQDTYPLPADFWKMIELASPVAFDGVIVTDRLTPALPNSVFGCEVVTIVGSNLHIYPTPSYTIARLLRYGAGFIETGAPPVYAAMTEREASIILLLAQSLAHDMQESAAASGLTSYQQGDLKVTYNSGSTSASSQSDKLRARYQAKVTEYIGSVMRQA